MADDPVMQALITAFADEARAICGNVTRQVMELEHGELDTPTLVKRYEELSRALHTLKGNSNTFGFAELAVVSHRMEDIVAPLRTAKRPIPQPIADVLLRATDVFATRLSTEGRAAPDELPPLAPLVAELEAAVVAVGGREPRKSAPPPPVTPPPHGPNAALAPSVTAIRPAPTPEVDVEVDGWRVGSRHVVGLMTDIERLREIRLRLDERSREVNQALRAITRATSSEASEARARLTILSRSLAIDSAETAEVIESFEHQVKAIATLPLATIIDPLRRTVRDLCRQLGREARLSAIGGELSLDRRILEALKGPLVQLIRNAVDHGVEPPQERMRAGKHREGSIVIRAEQRGNLLVLEVEDDGAGLDADKIRATAIARNLVAADDAASMTTRELYHLVLRTGFSTRDKITEVSGRGVGLDIVSSKVAALAGTIEIESAPHQGTRFVLALPAELGSTSVLVVGCDEHQLGVPMLSIETIRTAQPSEIKASRTQVRYEHNGQLVPLYDLGAMLGLRPAVTTSTVVVVQARGRRVALCVDELIGDRDLVVRPLPAEVKDVSAYLGAATLAHGELLLVLSPDFLAIGHVELDSPQLPTRRVLVVDDSLAARALHRTILESGGYTVHAVGSARQALDHLRTAFYDITVADVRMAGMDGIDLVAELRAREHTRDMPVILVTAHDTDAERQRGLAAGADAFLSKKECISGRLLAEVASAIARRARA